MARQLIQPMTANTDSVVGSIVVGFSFILAAVVIEVSMSPITDWFTNDLMGQPGNPYAATVLGILPWTHIFTLVLGVLGIVVIWKSVFGAARYERGY